MHGICWLIEQVTSSYLWISHASMREGISYNSEKYAIWRSWAVKHQTFGCLSRIPRFQVRGQPLSEFFSSAPILARYPLFGSYDIRKHGFVCFPSYVAKLPFKLYLHRRAHSRTRFHTTTFRACIERSSTSRTRGSHLLSECMRSLTAVRAITRLKRKDIYDRESPEVREQQNCTPTARRTANGRGNICERTRAAYLRRNSPEVCERRDVC